ncbi:MAG: hypothetical protein WCP85_29695 [Mariniphaga sp.]
MKKQNRSILITAIILIVTVGNYMTITESSHTRAVESLTCFVMGALTGILIFQVAQLLRDRKNNLNK